MAEKLNKLLMQGILPDDLNFSKQPDELDIGKIKYNSFYKTYDYHLSTIPKALHKVPGIDQLVQEKMNHALSPLESIDKRRLASDSILADMNQLIQEKMDHTVSPLEVIENRISKLEAIEKRRYADSILTDIDCLIQEKIDYGLSPLKAIEKKRLLEGLVIDIDSLIKKLDVLYNEIENESQVNSILTNFDSLIENLDVLYNEAEKEYNN